MHTALCKSIEPPIISLSFSSEKPEWPCTIVLSNVFLLTLTALHSLSVQSLWGFFLLFLFVKPLKIDLLIIQGLKNTHKSMDKPVLCLHIPDNLVKN